MTNEIKTWKQRFDEWRSPVFRGLPIDDSEAYIATRHLLAEIAELRAKVESLAADAERLEKLEAALRPFAKFAPYLRDNPSTDRIINEQGVTITAGHFVDALIAMAKEKA